MANRLTRWLIVQRSSPRLAFLLQIGCRALTALFSFLWIPLLLGSMGKALNGLLLSFQSITSLGGLGDLGMGGLVNIQTSRLLGQGKDAELRKFLAAARAFFGIMALLGAATFLVISPGLLHWQKFQGSPTFSVGDLKEPSSLAAKLKAHADGVSGYIYGRLGESTRLDLAQWQGPKEVSPTLQRSLIEGLNAIIGGTSLWDAECFRQVNIRQETRDLLERNPHGKDLARLNRLLLEDAYPMELSRNPKVGPLAGLCVVGALAIALLILNSYVTNLNYGCGNVVWPVIPLFVIMQLAFFGHWLLARKGASLWAQYIPYQTGAVLIFLLGWVWIRVSHPSLGTIRPLTVDWRQFVALAGKSFWVYLYALSGSIYTTISTLLITAHFGPAVLVTFRYNTKLCDLAYFVVNSACIASLPKITQWLASPEAGLRGRALRETERLNKFQTLMGCSAALVYLAVNDSFIRLWLGKSLHAPLPWQAAFAASLAVTSGGLAGFELAARCCDGGIRVGGVTVALTALLNLGLSLVAIRLGSIFGLALATVVTQSALTLGLGWYACHQMKTSWWRLSLRNWFLALGTVGMGILLRVYLPISSIPTAGVAAAVCLAAVLLVAFLLGIRFNDLWEEFAILRGIFGKR